MTSISRYYKLKCKKYSLFKYWGKVHVTDSQKWTFTLESKSHQIDVRTLVDGFGGFCQLLYAINDSISDNEEITVKIDAVKPGSFEIGIEFWRTAPLILATVIANDIGNTNIKAFIEILKNFLNLSSFLGGDKPDRIENLGDGTVNVIKGDKNIVTSNSVMNIFIDNNNASAFTRQSAKAILSDKSVDGFNVADQSTGEVIYKAGKSEIERLAAKNAYMEGETRVYYDDDAVLTVSTVNLEGKGKWKCYYRGDKVNVKIEDEGFINKVKAGEMEFANKDILSANLRIESERCAGSRIWEDKTYAAVEIRDHRKAIDAERRQGNLFPGELI